MKLGVCYYPEHWPESMWREDAMRMSEIGITRVRIGEFAWSRIEPQAGRFCWGWLDRALEVLADQGLEIVLGTPTATPPKWLIDLCQDILSWDEKGRVRGFGSRRHYDFSSTTYRREAVRIVTAMAERYGRHPAVVAWQTDNEFGCHDTVESYSPAAAEGFKAWLAAKYGDVDALNRSWGNVFWSMEYAGFSEIDPPNLTVTEANPAHRLDFQRFSSDQVAAFNRLQADILRSLSPGRDIVHNFMGFFTAFDHYAVGADLDVATWDSYPLGFLEQGWWDGGTKARFARQGHPDIAGFHHDLYRGVCRGRWQVMEQQPGPVNWARFNPSPLPGMVRLWTWEAFAHGAEVVSYFRWRQAPFAQEQMHAGLLRPDSVEDWGAREARQVCGEMSRIGPQMVPPAAVALVFDYAAHWVLAIQPQGGSFSYLRACFEWYGVLRHLGLDVDIVGPNADLSAYALIVCPSLPIVSEDLAARLEAANGVVVLGPRCGSKTADYQVPGNLPPGRLAAFAGVKVTRVESLRSGVVEQLEGGGLITDWFEHVEFSRDTDCLGSTHRGAPVWLRRGRARYVAGWADEGALRRIMNEAVEAASLAVTPLPEMLRLRRTESHTFVFNYGSSDVDLATVFAGADGFSYALGGPILQAAGVAAWAR